ncbi:MAG TPA: oxygen-independent coproporphyrinogen III oxidase [Caulobacteraceae bacterium]|nr:oxygen-independent coproporphyrinogen III oxidase [Caulobacteraceae bacterium]
MTLVEIDTSSPSASNELSALIAKYDGRAPRYTSYPTAVQFTPEVTSQTYGAWLRDLPTDRPVSLYLHIPFCARLCWYCGCNTRAVNRHAPIGDYVQLLIREIALLQEALPATLAASAIHLGGGTPNMLSLPELDVIFDRLGEVFRLTPDLEVAAELDPAVLTREWVMAASARGLSRASLGVQNLSPQVQRAVNRLESFEDIARCVGWLREAGVASINLDLMYGLPHQTTQNTLSTLDLVLGLRPERLALFGYAHVPWMKTHQRLIDEAALPGAQERLDQSESAAARLAAEGYVRIGLDHFALADDPLSLAQSTGRLRRNFQGYTTDAATSLIGFGASAIGRLPQGYVQNHARELDWRIAVSGGRLPVARGVAVTGEDALRAEIIERLMCDFAVDVAAVSQRHGHCESKFVAELARLQRFVDDGLVQRAGPKIEVTPRGRLLVRSIAAVFDQYFQAEAVRHSRAI